MISNPFVTVNCDHDGCDAVLEIELQPYANNRSWDGYGIDSKMEASGWTQSGLYGAYCDDHSEIGR